MEDYIDDIEWEVEPTDGDDYGDKEWQWYVKFFLNVNGKRHLVYDDYYRKRPNDVVIYNNMLESIKDGSMGEIIKDILNKEI